MKYSNVKGTIPPVFFTPHRQARRMTTMYYYVRTGADQATMLRTMAGGVQRLDPMLPVEDLRTMPEQVRLETFEDRMISTLAASFALLATLLASVGLYGVPSYSVAQRTALFERGVVASGDWLQANSLPLDRDAFQSAAADVSFRGRGWTIDGGWLRVARSLSTVQGGSISFGRLLPWKRLLFIPGVGGFVGRGQRSVDSTGFDFVDPATGAIGHTPRYSYSSGASVGGGAGLTLEIPLYRFVAARGVA